ncbi:MAG: hypothetical protein M3R43_08415 [Acidobacteriota bacterium]|nr:hypothetical protein [Acidobacteriota bacterium]
MIDETTNTESMNSGFCQDCGRPLTPETARTVGSARFCEPCLGVRVGTSAGFGAATPPAGATAPSYANVPPVPPNAGPVYTEPFPPVGGSFPRPALAGWLGLIPGVGAMYNGQFAKGLAHILIFMVLSSLADRNDFLGILVAGWVLYMAFDAYHTAKARRDGLPLPDPFGLNDIGRHIGLHFRGNGGGVPPNPVHSGGYAGYSGASGTVPPPPASEPSWGSVPVPPPVSPYTQQAAPVWGASAAPPPAGQEWANTAPYYAGQYPAVPMRSSRFPGAAVWLIGFGVLFLLFNIVPDLRFSIHRIFPIVLMALGIGIFVKRMVATGGIGPSETEGGAYASRSICSLRAPVILFTIGLLMTLQAFDVIRFGRTWPVLVIVIGALMLLERSFGGRVVPAMPVAGVVPSSDANAANGDGKGL